MVKTKPFYLSHRLIAAIELDTKGTMLSLPLGLKHMSPIFSFGLQ